jgi:hypothetical protein
VLNFRLTDGDYVLLPDKLPFTTIAVGIAAAVQAATTTTFLPACAWGLVILATVGEVTWRGLKDAAGWKRWQKYGLYSLASALSISFVCWLGFQAYRKEYLTEYLHVSFNLPHPGQIGTDRLDLNYVILNKNLFSVLVKEIMAIEIATTDFSNDPSRNAELCGLQALHFHDNIVKDTWPHPGTKVLHSAMDRPPLPPAAYGAQGSPPFPDDWEARYRDLRPKDPLGRRKRPYRWRNYY